jgi:hypothetical protein
MIPYGKRNDMRLAIMQPYFLPYIGYFQLIKAVDVFVIYDNVQFIKQGWINRNRYLNGNEVSYFSLPLQKGSTFTNIDQRLLSEKYDPDRFFDKFKGAYKNAPYFKEITPLLRDILQFETQNLAEFVGHSLKLVSNYLDLQTKFENCSQLPLNHNLQSEERVLDICNHYNANRYVNALNGRKLYDPEHFKTHGIDLKFIQSQADFGKNNLPPEEQSLSILHLLMHMPRKDIIRQLDAYELISGEWTT